MEVDKERKNQKPKVNPPRLFDGVIRRVSVTYEEYWLLKV